MYFQTIRMISSSACSLVGFSQPKPASQQCFSLTINQHQPAQISPETNQRTGRMTEGNIWPSGISHERRITFTSVAVTCMIACMMTIAHWTPLNQSRPNQSTLRHRKILSVVWVNFQKWICTHRNCARHTHTQQLQQQQRQQRTDELNR